MTLLRNDPVLEHPALHTFTGVSFGGVRCAQQWVDFVIWEAVLNDNPQLRGIVEIGTFEGGFSLWLAAQAEAREMEFFCTYDVIQPARNIPGFVRADVFAEVQAIASRLWHRDPLALFCDGGNKARELRTFAPHLSSESVIAIHDWNTEFFEEEIPDGLEMVYRDYCEDLGSPTRWFRRA